jgi:hypothetical protein
VLAVGVRKGALLVALVLAGALCLACGETNRSSSAGHQESPMKGPTARSRLTSLLDFLAGTVKSPAWSSPEPETSVRFRDVQYHLEISDAGSIGGYTLAGSTAADVTVAPSSIARFEQTDVTALHPATAASRILWLAAGRPNGNGTREHVVMTSPRFSFTPQGATFTFQDVRLMPTSAKGIVQDIREHLLGYGRLFPTTASMLTQFGFLLAVAPLTPAVRAHMWLALMLLPGIQLCGNGTDLLGREGQGICADGTDTRVEILVDVAKGSVLAVESWLLRISPLYPTLRPSALIEADTFSLVDSNLVCGDSC